MPTKQNVSSFVQTLESGSIRVEGTTSSCSSNKDRSNYSSTINIESQKVSFAVGEKELEIKSFPKEDDS